MTPWLDDGDVIVHAGDCLEVMRELAADSIDAVITDPPYGLGFMGKEWDDAAALASRPASADETDARYRNVFPRTGKGPQAVAFDGHAFQAWCEAWAREALRVLKPGGHLAAFGGTRTAHRLASGIEDAGFEIRDTLAWLHGQGFPKSLDVSKAIDKRRDWPALAELRVKIKDARTRLGISQSEAARRVGLIATDESLGGGGFMWYETGKIPTREQYERLRDVLELGGDCDGAFEEAERERIEYESKPGMAKSWDTGGGKGWNGASAVGPDAITPEAERWQGWGTALKPAHEPITLARKPLAGTVAANVLEHGTGALHIDACRIESGERPVMVRTDTVVGANAMAGESTGATSNGETTTQGRWPANVLLDAEAAALLDQQTGELASGALSPYQQATRGDSVYQHGANAAGKPRDVQRPADRGGASRFFYTAKASGSERNDGLHDLPARHAPHGNHEGRDLDNPKNHLGGLQGTRAANTHPTVKPVDLMRWLIRLLAPPGALILDPFAGSGTTGVAARLENTRCILIEREAEYLPIIAGRLSQQSLLT